MKSIYKFLPLFLLPMAIFTSCEDEPEVGTPLFPVEEEFQGPKIYINEKSVPANSKEYFIVHTPGGLSFDEVVDSFYVYSTTPVTEDVTVTWGEDPALAASLKKDFTAIPQGAVEFHNATVVIPKGQKKSLEPVRYSLKKGESLLGFDENAVVALAIKDMKGYAAAGKSHNVFSLFINKMKTNIKPDATLEGCTKLTNDELTIYDQYGYENTDLLDDDVWSSLLEYDEVCIKVEFKGETNFVGFNYWSNEYAYKYKPRRVDIETSMDDKTYVSQGTFIMKGNPNSYNVNVPTNVELFGAVNCKYVKLRFYDIIQSSYRINVGEVRFFKK